MGKTALVERLIDTAGEFTALSATADESERLTDLGVADQWLRAGGLDGPLAPALRDSADALNVGLELLALAQRDAPAVLVLDDAQWADTPSLRALMFMLRRLHAEAVLTVAVVRSGATGTLPEPLVRLAGADRIELGALSVEDVRELGASAGVELSADAAARLQEHALGMPLHVRALLAEVPAEAWERPERPPPASRYFAERVARTLDACEPEARALLEAASVLGVRWASPPPSGWPASRGRWKRSSTPPQRAWHAPRRPWRPRRSRIR